MPALFGLSLMALVFTGTTADHCIANDLGVKECVAYVKSTAVADYSNVND